MTDPRYILTHTNRYNERHHFVSLGECWPHRPECRLISQTTPDRIEATVFDTLPEALAILVEAGDPPDWVAEML